jgi:hypothetical protein
MASKQVMARQKDAASVVAAGQTHADRAARSVETALRPHLAHGEKMPDVALLMNLAARWLAHTAEAMVAADEAHEKELSDDAAPREARDAAAEKLFASVVELREVATGLLGAGATATLELTGKTPQEPVALSHAAGEVATALVEKKLPKSRVRGATFHAQEWADRLGEERGALDEALADVTKEEREAEATLITKTTAIAAYDDAFARVAAALGGLLKLAGEDDLAARVRPSTRRPGRANEDPAPTATTPAPTK